VVECEFEYTDIGILRRVLSEALPIFGGVLVFLLPLTGNIFSFFSCELFFLFFFFCDILSA